MTGDQEEQQPHVVSMSFGESNISYIPYSLVEKPHGHLTGKSERWGVGD